MRSRYLIAILGIFAISLAALVAAAPNPQEPAKREEEFVRVYRVADLIVPTRIAPDAPSVSSRAQWSADDSAAIQERLARLEKVVQVALPNRGGNDPNGQGAIAGYPENRSLVVRHTKAGHAAVETLLAQLRLEEDFEIELQVELAGLPLSKDGINTTETLQILRRPMTSDELAKIRGQVEIGMNMVLRVRDGRPHATFGEIGVPSRFIAVASADRGSVDVRVDHCTDDYRPGGTFPYASDTNRIPVGRTAGYVVDCDGSYTILLITPRVVPRS